MRRYEASMYDSNRWDGFELRPGDIIISTPPKCGNQVVGGSLTELAAHHRAPGHGRAMLARAGKSSLAYRAELATRRWRSTWPIS